MLWLAAMFAVGIAALTNLQISLLLLSTLCIVSAAAAFIAAKTKYATLLISAAFFVAGGVVYQAHLASITPDRIRSIYDNGQIASGEPVEITGKIGRAHV